MKEHKEVVKNVVDYIETHLEAPIDLDTIAKDIGYSKFYLNRMFLDHTGITIYRYLQNRRLDAAAEKLVKSDRPIAQIALEAGYDTQQSFSYAFKQIYQFPPNMYRERKVFVPKQTRIFMNSSCAGNHMRRVYISNGMRRLYMGNGMRIFGTGKCLEAAA